MEVLAALCGFIAGVLSVLVTIYFERRVFHQQQDPNIPPVPHNLVKAWGDVFEQAKFIEPPIEEEKIEEAKDLDDIERLKEQYEVT